MNSGWSWKRRIGLTSIALLALLSAGAFLVLGRTTVESVAPNVHVLRTGNGLSGIGANVTVFSSPESTIIVDSQLGALAKRIKRLAASSGAAPVQGVINTHWHPDHTGGNAALSGGAPILAHPRVLERLSTPQEGLGLTKPGSRHTFEARPEADLPTELVVDTATLHLGGRTLLLLHPGPAHTDGDLVIYDESERVLVVGDLVWPHSFPFVDTYNGGSATGLTKALADLLSWIPSDALVIPGHGAPFSATDLAAYHDMVDATVREVGQYRSEGLSVVEAQTRGLGAEWSSWSSKLVPEPEWIAMVYRSLESPVSLGR